MAATTTDQRGARLLALTTPQRLELPWRTITLVAFVLAGIATLLTDGTPTYDPWAWIIWGRETIEGDLVTTTGPSWKPLPMLFTVPFALFGDAAPDLWLWVARATALLGLVAVAELAARLGGRLAAWVAVIALATTPLYYAYGINGSSEGMLVLFCVLAALAWLDDRRTAAFWWLTLAAALRPEVWPFVALLGLERIKDRPPRFWWVAAAGAVTLISWLGPEKVGSGEWTRAATRANAPNPDSAAFAASPTIEVLGSMGDLLLWVPAIGLVLACVIAAGVCRSGRDAADPVVDRDTLRSALVVTVAALVWVAIVAAMTEGGYAGNPRYLVAPLGILAAVGVAGLAWTMRLLARRGGVRVAELVALAMIVALVVAAGARLPRRTADNAYQTANRAQIDQLARDPAVRRAVAECRPVLTHPLLIPPVAWSFGMHLNEVGFHPETSGTFIVGRNVEANLARPERLPEGARQIASTGQLTVYTTC